MSCFWFCLIQYVPISFILHTPYGCRLEEVDNFIKYQEREMEDFVEERDMLIKTHGDDKAAMKRRHWEEEVELEKEFDTKLTQLMDKYSKLVWGLEEGDCILGWREPATTSRNVTLGQVYENLRAVLENFLWSG